MLIRGMSSTVVKPSEKIAQRPSVRFSERLPQGDVFEKSAPPNQLASPGKSCGETLKALLKDAPKGERKGLSAYLLEQATGIKPMAKQPDNTQPSAEKKEEMNKLAEQVKALSPVERVNLMREVTGPESPFSKVAEVIIINKQFPGLGDVANLFKPNLAENNVEGLSAAIQAIGLGLLILPVVAPTALLLRPDLLGGLLAKVALWMI